MDGVRLAEDCGVIWAAVDQVGRDFGPHIRPNIRMYSLHKTHRFALLRETRLHKE